MARSHLSKSSPLVVLAGVLLLAGCPDPQEKYDEFLDRTGQGAGGTGGGAGGAGGTGGSDGRPTCDPTAFFDIEGEFLMAIDTTLGRGNPLLFRTTTETNAEEDGSCPSGGCMITRFSAQPIVPFNRTQLEASCPASGTPVGDVIEIVDIPVSETGEFEAAFGQQEVDRCANPITGRDIVATITLEGLTVSEDIYAGAATGRVSVPLQAPLRGSTFASVRIEGDLDETPAKTCEEAIADVDTGTGGTGGAGGAGGTGGAGAAGGSGGAGGTAGAGGGGGA